MTAIAGCTRPTAQRTVEEMLHLMHHRGTAGSEVVETPYGTLGAAWSVCQSSARQALEDESAAIDSGGAGRMASARVTSMGLRLSRDMAGVAPLYFGAGPLGSYYFASEVKALLPFTKKVRCLPAGHTSDGIDVLPFQVIVQGPPLTDDPVAIAQGLRARLTAAVADSVQDEVMAAWLSGGLDSSVIAALARPLVGQLHTFAAGLANAPDLEFASVMARHIGAQHHEIVVTAADLLELLPAVIYHLESFDALLVRSSVMNYLVGRAASEYAPATLSGEGGDELFAGYAYLKEMDPALLADELLDITGRLHNTALQRVDRSSAAHGIVAHVPFLAPEVIAYAVRIPVALKLRDGVEKWILREAADDLLPAEVLNRTKAKFWEGAGVGDLLAAHAEARISDQDFRSQCMLPNGWKLRTKEELLYYRIFREHFGELDDLEWMGRTKGAPQV